MNDVRKEPLVKVLQAEGLGNYKLKHTPNDGLTREGEILVDFNNFSLFLHEVAHAKRGLVKTPILNGDKTGHDATFADIYTDLVKKYMTPNHELQRKIREAEEKLMDKLDPRCVKCGLRKSEVGRGMNFQICGYAENGELFQEYGRHSYKQIAQLNKESE